MSHTTTATAECQEQVLGQRAELGSQAVHHGTHALEELRCLWQSLRDAQMLTPDAARAIGDFGKQLGILVTSVEERVAKLDDHIEAL